MSTSDCATEAPLLKRLLDKLQEVASRHDDRSCDYDVCSVVRDSHAALAQSPAGTDAATAAIKLLVAAGYVTEAKANEALNIAHGFQRAPLQPIQDANALDAAKWRALCERYAHVKTSRSESILELFGFDVTPEAILSLDEAMRETDPAARTSS